MSVDGWTHANCGPSCFWDTRDWLNIGADAAAATRTLLTPSPLAAGLLGADNHSMDFFCRYLRPSAFISSFFPLSFFLSLSLSLFVSSSLPIVSFVLQTEQWSCLSEAHLSRCPGRLSGWIWRDSGHTRCTGGNARLVHKHTKAQSGPHTHKHVHTTVNAAQTNKGDLAHAWALFDLTLTQHKTPPLQPHG